MFAVIAAAKFWKGADIVSKAYVLLVLLLKLFLCIFIN